MKNFIDVEGIERWVIGFSKIPDKDGEYLEKVRYKLNNISLNKLRAIFNVDMTSKDHAILDMIGPLDIDKEQAQLLNHYTHNEIIDTNKYYFELHCCQAPGYDWSEGFPKKIADS